MSARKERQRRYVEARKQELRERRVQGADPAAQALIDEIHEAFEGVDRYSAISWNDANVIDDYGADSKLFPDSDSCWEDLIKDPRWYGDWPWVYLDPKGFRYYLPAAMIRNILGDYSVSPSDNALATRNRFTPDDVRLDRWACLSDRQVKSVADYLKFLNARAKDPDEIEYEEDSCWDRYFEERATPRK